MGLVRTASRAVGWDRVCQRGIQERFGPLLPVRGLCARMPPIPDKSGPRLDREQPMNMKRFVTFGATVAAVVALTAGTASANECFVANRSAAGNAAVGAHSGAWDLVSLDTVLTQFIGVPQPVADCVIANAAQFGLPTSFVFGVKQAVGQGGVIAENNPNFAAKGLGSNGQGIDHGEDAYGPSVGAAIGFCTA